MTIGIRIPAASVWTGVLIFLGLVVGIPYSEVRAQTGPVMMISSLSDEPSFEMSTLGLFTSTEAKSSGTDVELSVVDSFGRYRMLPNESSGLTLGYDLVFVDLGTSDSALPDRLVDQAVGVGLEFEKLETETLGTWVFGASLGIGHAGVEPYKAGDGWYGQASVYTVHPIDANSNLLVVLEYDGNRINYPDFPLPGIAYQRTESEKFSWVLGIPISRLSWTPSPRFDLSIEYFAPTEVSATASYEFVEGWSLFVGYQHVEDAFHLSDGDAKHRLFFRQSRLGAGLGYAWGERVQLRLTGGLAFEQKLRRGFNRAGASPVRDLAESPFVAGYIEFRF